MRALVTGGGGFLGKAIVRQLRARGDEVTVVGRRVYPEVLALGAVCAQADLADPEVRLAPLFEAHDVVFHAAALPPYNAPYAVFEATNVHGTDRVIEACHTAGVPRLVYTSTPSVTFDGGDAEGVSEADAPYPQRFLTAYAETKARAEQAVLAANGAGLATTALRPHLIYGEGEPHMLPRVAQRNRAGRLRIIGDGANRVGLTYVDNAAWAHLQAADALTGPDAPNAGRAYFLTDPEPVALWPWINRFLEGIGEPPVQRHISLAAAKRVGGVLEALWRWLPLPGEPPMTRFVAAQLATHHYYDLSAAKADFGLSWPVSGEEGLARTIAWFKEHPP